MKFAFSKIIPLALLGTAAVAHAPKVREQGVVYSREDLFLGSGFNQAAVDSKLAECEIVQYMSDKHHEHDSEEASFIHRMFDVLFPFESAGWNAILATTYISGPPNLLLALIPPDIRPSSLKTMVAFAVGGLLGDVFLHLLPQVFFGEEGGGLRLVPVDEKRNIILGFGIFVGFVTFIIMDKFIRMLGAGHDHSHGHGHTHDTGSAVTEKAEASGAAAHKTTAKQRGGGVVVDASSKTDVKPVATEPEIKSSVWLNMIADFTHNITDGIALSASFYISKSVGATTFLAVFFHEIPHEVGDFALLIQGGFSKTRAMQAQFLTAVGAFMGTFLGIALNAWAENSGEASAISTLMGTSVTWGDLALPFTAGSFLYIGTVGVVPELLEEDEEDAHLPLSQKLLAFAVQLIAMFVGIGVMFVISWNE